MNEKQYEEMRRMITTQKQYLKELEKSNNEMYGEMYGEIIELNKQIRLKNTFLVEKHLTSKYAKWLVEYNKQKRAT